MVNLVNLSTPLGLAVATVGRARARPGVRGLTYAVGYRFGFPTEGAFTIGNVVLTRHGESYLTDDLVRHEEEHSWQYALCGGLPMIGLYALAAGWSYLRTGDYASANVFERRAGLKLGGYTEAPPRPLWDGVRAAGRSALAGIGRMRAMGTS